MSASDGLYAEFAPLVRRLVCQYEQDTNEDDLKDALYARFCALLAAFDPSGGVPLRPYLVRQLSLAAYAYAFQQRRIKKQEGMREIAETGAGQPGMFDLILDGAAALAHDQAVALLPAAFAKLPAPQRNVVIWRYYEERSFEEIAELMAIPPTSARALLRNALRNLRKAIGSTACS